MMNHTPGPWQAVIGNGAGDHWNIHQKTPTIDGGFFGRVDALNHNEQARATAQANAAIFAAAPDLLEALERYVESDNGIDDELTTMARAAIARASSTSAVHA